MNKENYFLEIDNEVETLQNNISWIMYDMFTLKSFPISEINSKELDKVRELLDIFSIEIKTKFNNTYNDILKILKIKNIYPKIEYEKEE